MLVISNQDSMSTTFYRKITHKVQYIHKLSNYPDHTKRGPLEIEKPVLRPYALMVNIIKKKLVILFDFSKNGYTKGFMALEKGR